MTVVFRTNAGSLLELTVAVDRFAPITRAFASELAILTTSFTILSSTLTVS